jgi:uncharacterized damage-inducible protein DinB
MTVREFHLQCRKKEFPAFERVLRALPQDQLHYTPHERSQTAERIIQTIVGETEACLGLIDTGELTFRPPTGLSSAQLIDAFTDIYHKLSDKVAAMSEADWAKLGQFKMGDVVAMEQPIGDFLWLFFFDAIHHRGQLSTYIRPMGGKVPSIYGPSGDEQPMRG